MSPSKFSVLLTWVLSVITQAQGGFPISGPSNLKTKPRQALITSGKPLFIDCWMPIVPPNGKLVLMTIERVLLPNVGAEPETVAKGSPSIANGVASRVPQTPERAIVKGTLKEKFLRLCFPTANCEDSGKYTCNARISTNGVITYYTEVMTVVIPGNPGNTTMDVPGTDCCIVGQTLTITCGQFVGTLDNTSQHNWVWEFKDKNDADWQTYVTGNPTANFTQRQPPSTNPCYTHIYSSSLSRRLTLGDSERQYRCYVNGSVTGQGVETAKVHPVGTVKALEASKSSQASATNWLAVGLGVAGTVACLGVGLGVAHHSKRKRSGQQSMTPAATPAPPPPLAGGNTETAMNTGDPALVGQSGQTNTTL